MGRLAFAILLITNLLVCPLRCFPCQTGGVVDDDCAQAACCCCQGDQDSDESSNEQPSHGEDCTCPNCICEGATVEADPEIPVASDCVGLGAWIVPTDDLLLSGTPHARIDARDRPPGYLGGRDALVAYQSWLI